MRAQSRAHNAATPARQVAQFIAKFAPAVAALVRAARKVLRERFPTAIELVYDNYNALAIGFASTERTSDVLVSLAVYARGVNLYFMYGARLPDPDHVLEGSGTRGRFVRLHSLAILDTRPVRALLLAAEQQAKVPLTRSGRGRIVVRSIARKQRPRRPGTSLTLAPD